MRLSHLLSRLGGRVLAGAVAAGDIEVRSAVVSNAMSELLSRAGPGALLVTSLRGLQLVRAVSLVDGRCLAVVDGEPPADVVRAAREAGLVLVTCGGDLDLVRRRLAETGLVEGVGR